MKTLRIDVWDSAKKEWRSFDVVPYEPNFAPHCRNGLHQFWPAAKCCACGGNNRLEAQT